MSVGSLPLKTRSSMSSSSRRAFTIDAGVRAMSVGPVSAVPVARLRALRRRPCRRRSRTSSHHRRASTPSCWWRPMRRERRRLPRSASPGHRRVDRAVDHAARVDRSTSVRHPTGAPDLRRPRRPRRPDRPAFDSRIPRGSRRDRRRRDLLQASEHRDGGSSTSRAPFAI